MQLAIDQSQFDTRRAFQRVQVDCEARLVTPGSYLNARLQDLSRSGARLVLDNPPAEGTTALLRWSTHDSLCTVAWASQIACGVAFVRPLTEAVLFASCGIAQTGDDLYPARLTQITFGRRRPRKTPVLLSNPLGESQRYSWTLALRRRPHSPQPAAEEIFFYGSPVAHVALWEFNQMPPNRGQ